MPNAHGNGADRRPWLILSRREGVALLRRVPGPALEQALRELQVQIAWIDGESENGKPSITAALQREASS